jgi:putative tryptophan/tyrosine transport system substrate-binding protein
MRLLTCMAVRAVVVVVSAFVILSAPSSPGVADIRVAILTSQEGGPYQEVITGFRNALDQQGIQAMVEVYALHGDSNTMGQVVQEIKAKGAQLLFTLGSLATQGAVEHLAEFPILATLVLSADELKQAPNATAVVLEFPVETELQWLHRILPQQQTIGVLFNPTENQNRITTAAQVAHNLGLKLLAQEVKTPQDLPRALDTLAQQADVLWGIADQTVFSPQTAEPILLFSFRNHIPFAGLSTAWVKAGALYALDRDYTDLGAQCGALASQILHGTLANTLPFAPPRKVTYALNLKTANHMKIDISQALIDGARQIFR